MENLYDILQVDQNASMKVIENSYKKLAKKYHPDVSNDKKKAEEIMKKINNAHDILTDEKKRINYDESLKIQEITKSEIKNNTQNKEKYDKNANYYNKDSEEYDNYYDYINKYNIISRIKHLSAQTKKMLIIIFIAILFMIIRLIFMIYNLFNNNQENNYNNSISNEEIINQSINDDK